MIGDNWRETAEYAEAMDYLQRGKWSEALAALAALHAAYPHESAIESLIAETQLRIEAGKHQISRRRLPRVSRGALLLTLLVFVLFLLGWFAVNLYRDVITPSLAQARAENQQAALVAQAEQAFAAGDYARTLSLYAQLSELNPDHRALADGIARARQAQALETAYQQARDHLAAGRINEAQAILIGIQRSAPAYRDVAVLLSQIERQQRVGALLRQAAEAKPGGDWEEVILRLEEVRSLGTRAERDQVGADLFQAYLELAGQLVSRSQGGAGELNRAVELYGKALALRPGAPQASTPRNWARQYLAGHSAFTAGRWDSAIAQLESLYADQPAYLNGQAAQLLYNAYVRSADALLQEGESTRAWERYTRAGQIQGVDASTARAMAARLATLMTPTPTFTPTPTTTVAPTLTPVPTATATPGYASLTWYRGKIVFWSNRGGNRELWVMDPDGRNAFHIWQQDKAQRDYEKLREAEARSPDGLSRVFVTTQPGSDKPQIFVAYPSGQTFRLTDWGGTQYDPVWSPKGYWIAFVSNEAGNDELYLIGADGDHAKRLTKNEWEWDKHPSWSPEGTRLAFWSNRVKGRGQIWIMNDDGTGVINISNNEFEETGPIWIK